MARRRKSIIQVDPAEIAKRAYQKFLERGDRPGSAEEDWLAAETELRAEKGADVVEFDVGRANPPAANAQPAESKVNEEV